jgi:DNA-binding transcriptional ArsR family regulator
MGLFDVFRKKVKKAETSEKKEKRVKSAKSVQVSVQKKRKQHTASAEKEKTLEAKTVITPDFGTVSSSISHHETTHKKLDNVDKKLDELLEIKQLYNDMLDWLVELARQSKTQRSGERVDVSAMVSDKSGVMSILSPRLRQIYDLVEERGEVIAEDVSESVGLSLNRSSELLNALHRANYVEKNRMGRKVYYRKQTGAD